MASTSGQWSAEQFTTAGRRHSLLWQILNSYNVKSLIRWMASISILQLSALQFTTSGRRHSLLWQILKSYNVKVLTRKHKNYYSLNQWGRRLDGWSNTAARPANWRRVTRQVWFCTWWTGRIDCLFCTAPVALTWAAQLRVDGISSYCYIVNIHNHLSWATSRKEGMIWYSSRPMPSICPSPCFGGILCVRQWAKPTYWPSLCQRIRAKTIDWPSLFFKCKFDSGVVCKSRRCTMGPPHPRSFPLTLSLLKK